MGLESDSLPHFVLLICNESQTQMNELDIPFKSSPSPLLRKRVAAVIAYCKTNPAVLMRRVIQFFEVHGLRLQNISSISHIQLPARQDRYEDIVLYWAERHIKASLKNHGSLWKVLYIPGFCDNLTSIDCRKSKRHCPVDSAFISCHFAFVRRSRGRAAELRSTAACVGQRRPAWRTLTWERILAMDSLITPSPSKVMG